jgi:hypothetical protein
MVEVVSREPLLERVVVRVHTAGLGLKKGTEFRMKPWDVLPLKPGGRVLPRQKLKDLVWQYTHDDFKGFDGNTRNVLDRSVKHGTMSVPLDSLTDAELFDKLPKRVRESFEKVPKPERAVIRLSRKRTRP